MPKSAPAESPSSNSVILEGRIVGIEHRAMPSGDEAVTFRVVVERPARERGPSGRVSVDALDCVCWRADVRRRVEACEAGTRVRVEGVRTERSRGRLVVEFADLDDLRRIADLIEG